MTFNKIMRKTKQIKMDLNAPFTGVQGTPFYTTWLGSKLKKLQSCLAEKQI